MPHLKMEDYVPQKQKPEAKPAKAKPSVPAVDRIRQIVDLLRQKKAEDITVFNLSSVNDYLEYFVIATANSDTHLHGLAKDVGRLMKTMQESRFTPLEPGQTGWLVLDYVDVVVHILTEEKREFYNLDRLWGDSDNLTDQF